MTATRTRVLFLPQLLREERSRQQELQRQQAQLAQEDEVRRARQEELRWKEEERIRQEQAQKALEAEQAKEALQKLIEEEQQARQQPGDKEAEELKAKLEAQRKTYEATQALVLAMEKNDKPKGGKKVAACMMHASDLLEEVPDVTTAFEDLAMVSRTEAEITFGTESLESVFGRGGC